MNLLHEARSIKRDSSIELLRVAAMLMIIACHFAGHGGFNFSGLSVNYLWYQFLFMHGQLGNNLFVLISGYFLIKSDEIKFGRLNSILLQTLFYFLLMIYCLNRFKISFSIHALLSNWWFVKTYIMLYLIHPYINILLNNLSRERYKKMLIIFGLFLSLVPVLAKWFFEHNSLINFVYVYSIGGYFKLYAKDYGNKKFILYGILFMILNIFCVTILNIIGLKTTFIGMMKPFTLGGYVCF